MAGVGESFDGHILDKSGEDDDKYACNSFLLLNYDV